MMPPDYDYEPAQIPMPRWLSVIVFLAGITACFGAVAMLLAR